MSGTTTSSAIDEEIMAAVFESMGKTAPSSTTGEEKQEVPEFIEEAGKIRYSSLFGDSYTGREHNITLYEEAHWDEEVRMFIPKLNPAYVFPPEATELLVLAIEMGDRVLITGPTGSGKSSLIEQVCAKLQRPFIRINMTGDMESSIFFGQMTVENGATVWKNGPITEAVIHGAVCLVDEWELSPPDINMGLQWLLEDNGKLFLKERPATSGEKLLIPHSEFRLVMGGNTLGLGDETGSHSGVNVQNTATLDRFQTVIKHDYLNTKHELELLKKAVPDLSDNNAKRMVQLAGVIRSAYKNGDLSLTMSPRTLINWGRKTAYWGNPLTALRISFFAKIPDNEKEVVNKLVNKVFSSTL